MATNITLTFADDNPAGTNNNDGWRVYRIEQSDGTDPCPDTYIDGDLEGYPIPVEQRRVAHEHGQGHQNPDGKGEITFVDDTVLPGKRYFYRPSFYRNAAGDPGMDGEPTIEAVYRIAPIGPIAVPSAAGLGYPYNIPSDTSGVAHYATVEPIIHFKAEEELNIHGPGLLRFQSSLSNLAESWKSLKFTNRQPYGNAWIDNINNKGPDGDLEPVPAITCNGNNFLVDTALVKYVLGDEESTKDPLLHFPEGYTTFAIMAPTLMKADIENNSGIYPLDFSGGGATYLESYSGTHPTYNAWQHSTFTPVVQTGATLMDARGNDNTSTFTGTGATSKPYRITSDFGKSGPVPISSLGYSNGTAGEWEYCAKEIGICTMDQSTSNPAQNYTYTHQQTSHLMGYMTTYGGFEFKGRLWEPRKAPQIIGTTFQGADTRGAKQFHLFCIHVGPNNEQTIWVNGGDPVASISAHQTPEAGALFPTRGPFDDHGKSDMGRKYTSPFHSATGASGAFGPSFNRVRLGEFISFPKALSTHDIQRVSDHLRNSSIYAKHMADLAVYNNIPTY